MKDFSKPVSCQVMPQTPRWLDQRLSRARFNQFAYVAPVPGDLGEWRERAGWVARRLRVVAGLLPEPVRIPLAVESFAEFEHADCVVTPVRFESRPGIHVTGTLYRSSRQTGRAPGVLCPHGHWPSGRIHHDDRGSIPARCLALANLGFVVFSYDMIGYNDSRDVMHRWPPALAREAALWGIGTCGLQLWNSIRAVDFLCSLTDVDPERIGCTGASGGGSQTWNLAAVDDRVKVVAPVCMLSSHYQGGCQCEEAPLMRLGDLTTFDIVASLAPRPILLPSVTGDWTNLNPEYEIPRLRRVYALHGAGDRVGNVHFDAGHNYNQSAREAVYGFMAKWLLHGGRKTTLVEESAAPVPAREQLLVFDKEIPPYKGAIRAPKKLIDTWRASHTKPASADAVLDVLAMEMPAKQDILVRSQPAQTSYRSQRDTLHTITYGRFSQDSSLQAAFLPPGRGVNRSILLLRSWSDQAAWRRFCQRPPAVVRELMDAGVGIVIPLLFGQQGSGDVDVFRDKADSYLASTYLKTEHMHRADDVATTVRMAQVELGIRPASLTIVAEAGMGLLAYAAWSFLQHQRSIGPLVADLGGVDLRAPATWVKRAYIPLLLGAGGAAGLAQLSKAGKGILHGVRSADRALLPRSMRTTVKRATLAKLIADSGK